MQGYLIAHFAISLFGLLLSLVFPVEMFFDFVSFIDLGILCSVSYFASTGFLRQRIDTILISLYCFRLGTLGLTRALAFDRESKFDHVRGKPIKIIFSWILQFFWIWITALPLLTLNSKIQVAPLQL
jgi:steroid 5-alpha reductase family enzyme